MSAESVQTLLRLLSQEAKIPLATALSKIKELQAAGLGSADEIAKTKIDSLKTIFVDEKKSKQVLSAAKRVVKKRAAADDNVDAKPAVKKRKPADSLFETSEELSPAAIEESLILPTSDLSEDGLSDVVLHTNRAPLVLAFVVTLLKHTMPGQPLSSRLSLAQAYVSITSRSRAVSLGIESGKSAEEEGFGDGQPVVTIMGKDIRVIRRYDYDWNSPPQTTEVKNEPSENEKSVTLPPNNEEPALWALDLEARKSLSTSISRSEGAGTPNMPIFTPQSARKYLLKSFSSAPEEASHTPPKKLTAAARSQSNGLNLGKLLRCLDILYDSWASSLSPTQLNDRTWSWYAKVRPSVEEGVAGWGGKNQLKLADILSLRSRS
ncbi:uncharacterized protein K489DRAFT_313021 [Dissoconium aciculare CBS 342.82]|uniref:Impact N-terminal domain-containing protein n=1 Tax=Dissoconium aciculare CBS 342.82 TaxID=1314786 RepID=A0A6J3MEY1_9PEZI|nr:uncharacterized protein K489DRAFT_313021 [Dissoconium aciculare CBS 342.82]KAF1826418.1 hypothetical protein K489DRAFT_313021 [Dissoconium aciculare CBS 342.82]